MLKRSFRRFREDEGFTLIELMVVVLIIGILIAIALPTFLGARSRAQNRAAQSDVRNALVAAKTLFTDTSSFTGATAAGLTTVEGSLVFVAGAPAAGSSNVGVMVTPTATTWLPPVSQHGERASTSRTTRQALAPGTVRLPGRVRPQRSRLHPIPPGRSPSST